MEKLSKKFIVICWVFFIFLNGAQANIIDFIKTNFEYLTLPQDIYIGQPYTSSAWKTYYFLGSFKGYYFDTNNIDSLTKFLLYMKSQNLTGVFVFLDDKIYFLSQDLANIQNQIAKSCLKVQNIKQEKLLSYHPDIFKIKLNQILSDQINTDSVSCAYSGSDVWVVTNNFTRTDLPFLIKNYDYVFEVLSKFNPKDKDFVKKIYTYILSKTDYDYSTVKNVEKDGSVSYTYPWQVSTFFKWWKLVCDGYVKTFLFFLRYGGLSWQRIVWKIQPVDSRFANLWTYLHSWVQLSGSFYDPTFDDTVKNGALSYMYFDKPKPCFVLEHYFSGELLFQTKDQRRDYIQQNIDTLQNSCPDILANVLISDEKVLDYIKLIFQKYNHNYIAELLCKMFGICLKEVETKQQILSKLYTYKLYFSKGVLSGTVDFSQLKTWQIYTGSVSTGQNVSYWNKTVNFVATGYTLSVEEKIFLLQMFKKYPFLKEKLDSFFEKKLKKAITSYPESKQKLVKEKLIQALDRLLQKPKYQNNPKIRTILLYLKYRLMQWK